MIKLDYTDRYYVDQILSQSQVDHLRKMYYSNDNDAIDKESIHGLVNRGHFKQRDDVVNSVTETLLDHAIQVNKTLGKITDLKLKTMYFQEYLLHSHLPEHFDVIGRHGVTLVTLIDKSDDLIGGDLLVIDKMSKFKQEHKLDHITKDRYTPIKNIDDVNVYTLLPQQVGETAMYITGTVHSISKVLKGHRLVLVSWFDT